jgi:carboxyl-terminal processing protease
VQAGYYAPDFHGKHWDQIVTSHRRAILDAPTTEVFEQEMAAMLADLDSSMGLLGPNSKITPRNAINASFHSVDVPGEGERWVFQDVAPGGVAQRCGVAPGDVLLAINRALIAPPDRPAFEMGKATQIEVFRGNERKQMALDLKTPAPRYKDNPYAESTSITGTLTSDNIAIVKVSLFPGKIEIDFANTLSNLFRNRLSGAERVLIDLRGNPGGGIGNLRLMSLFTPHRQPVGYSLDRITAEKGTPKERLPRLGNVPSQKWERIPLAIKFGSKKSVVLETEGLGAQPFTDTSSFS